MPGHGFGVIALDLHYPLRLLFGVILSPSPASPMWWMGTVSTASTGLLVLEVGSMFRGHERIHNVSCLLASFMAILAPSTLGAVFGVLASKPFWHGSFTPPSLLMAALLAGIALLGIVFACVVKFRLAGWERASSLAIPGLRVLLTIALFTAFLVVGWQVLTSLYGGVPGLSDAMWAMVVGPLAPTFWIGKILVGLISAPPGRRPALLLGPRALPRVCPDIRGCLRGPRPLRQRRPGRLLHRVGGRRFVPVQRVRAEPRRDRGRRSARSGSSPSRTRSPSATCHERAHGAPPGGFLSGATRHPRWSTRGGLGGRGGRGGRRRGARCRHAHGAVRDGADWPIAGQAASDAVEPPPAPPRPTTPADAAFRRRRRASASVRPPPAPAMPQAAGRIAEARLMAATDRTPLVVLAAVGLVVGIGVGVGLAVINLGLEPAGGRPSPTRPRRPPRAARRRALERARQPDRRDAAGGLHGLPQDAGDAVNGRRSAIRSRAGASCTSCHANDRAREDGAGPLGDPRGPVPRLPHGDDPRGRGPTPLVAANSKCLSCHGTIAPLPASMKGRSRSTCWLCHQGTSQPAPPFPHPLPADGTCLTCHVAGKMGALPADHATRTDDSARRATSVARQPRVAPHDLAYDGHVRVLPRPGRPAGLTRGPIPAPGRGARRDGAAVVLARQRATGTRNAPDGPTLTPPPSAG